MKHREKAKRKHCQQQFFNTCKYLNIDPKSDAAVALYKAAMEGLPLSIVDGTGELKTDSQVKNRISRVLIEPHNFYNV